MHFCLQLEASFIIWQVPNVVICKFYTWAIFCTLIIWALLRSSGYLRLRSFALFCIWLRLERPCLGVAYHSWASLLTVVVRRFLLTEGALLLHENALRMTAPNFVQASLQQTPQNVAFSGLSSLHWPSDILEVLDSRVFAREHAGLSKGWFLPGFWRFSSVFAGAASFVTVEFEIIT